MTEWRGSEHARPPEVGQGNGNSAFSPELALVSPELAAVARAAMAEPGEVRWGVFGFSVLRGDATPVRLRKIESATLPLPREAVEHEPVQPHWRELAARYAGQARSIAVLAAIAAALILFPELHFTGNHDRPKLRTPRAAPAPHQPGPVQLQWHPRAGAKYYNVQVFRQGKKIYEAWPVTPQLKLPTRWTFGGRPYRLTSGAYEWFVWPGFGDRSAARYGDLLQRNRFAVPR